MACHFCAYHRVWSKFVGEHHPLAVGTELILILGELTTVNSKAQSLHLTRPERSTQMKNVQGRNEKTFKQKLICTYLLQSQNCMNI